MLFKNGDLASEFLRAPGKLREAIHDLDDAMEEWGLGPLTITSVGRDPSFYTDGTAWSWHFVFSAIDLRTKDLSFSKKLLVLDWLRKRCPKSEGFDVVPEKFGKPGEHIHIELEDQDLKRGWFQKHGAGVA